MRNAHYSGGEIHKANPMSKEPEKQVTGGEPVSEITLRLFTGAGMGVGELLQFDSTARSRGLTREELLVQMIREANAAAQKAGPAAA